MADKSRNVDVNILLLICALVGGIIFYGCSGGGSTVSSEVERQITGRVAIPREVIDSIDSIGALSSRARVAVESSPYDEIASDIVIVTEDIVPIYAMIKKIEDESVRYVLSPVTQGKHNVIARLSYGGKTYKMRSEDIEATGKTITETQELDLKEAVASFVIRIVDKNGNPIKGGKIRVWGEEVKADEQGCCTTPPMPLGTKAIIEIEHPKAAKHEITKLSTVFDNKPITQTVAVVEKNQPTPPIAYIYCSNTTMSKSASTVFEGKCSKSESEIKNVSWYVETNAVKQGTITPDTPSKNKATYSAPPEDCLATITYCVEDLLGLKASASIQIVVGGGVADSNKKPPVISNFQIIPANPVSCEHCELRVSAYDPDGDSTKLTYKFIYDGPAGGRIIHSGTHCATAAFIAPNISTAAPASLTVVVKDKKYTASQSIPITIDISAEQQTNQGPSANIIQPYDRTDAKKSLFKVGQQITFVASATDPENHPMKYSWHYKEDSQSTDTSEEAWNKFSVDELSETSVYSFDVPATYSIRLTVKDNYGSATTKVIKIRINERPTAGIVTTPDTAGFTIAQNVKFTASATDVETPPADLTYKWAFYRRENESSEEYEYNIGADATNPTFNRNNLQSGQYRVELTVTDKVTASGGATLEAGESSDKVEKNFEIKNFGPEMTIASPTSAYLQLGAVVTFEGEGQDYNNASIDGSAMEFFIQKPNESSWVSMPRTAGTNKAPFDFGQIGLVSGTYTVKLQGTDNDSIASFVLRDFLVCATPTVTIASPSANPDFKRYDTGSEIEVKVKVGLTKGDIASITWLNGFSGIETPLTATVKGEPTHANDTYTYTYSLQLTASGVYKLGCKVESKSGLASTAWVLAKEPYQDASFIVNTLPVATMSLKNPEDIYATGTDNIPVFLFSTSETAASVKFELSATDEDTNLPTTSAAWFTKTSSGESNQLATGTEYTITLPADISTITARVYDACAAIDGGKYKDFASSSVDFAVRVWQSRIYKYDATWINADALGASPFDITGEGKDEFYLSFRDLPTSKKSQYAGFEYTNTEGADYIKLIDDGMAETATGPASLTTVITGCYKPSTALIYGVYYDNTTTPPIATPTILQMTASSSSTIIATWSLVTDAPIHMWGNADASIIYELYLDKVIRVNVQNGYERFQAVTGANNHTFANLKKIRYFENSAMGNVFIVGQDSNDKNIIYRFANDDLSVPKDNIDVDNIASDAAIINGYVFVLKANSEIDIFDKDANRVMSFGGIGTDVNEKGKFYNPIAIYSSGKNLFILEDGDGTKPTGRLQVIRSGLSKFLEN